MRANFSCWRAGVERLLQMAVLSSGRNQRAFLVTLEPTKSLTEILRAWTKLSASLGGVRPGCVPCERCHRDLSALYAAAGVLGLPRNSHRRPLHAGCLQHGENQIPRIGVSSMQRIRPCEAFICGLLLVHDMAMCVKTIGTRAGAADF